MAEYDNNNKGVLFKNDRKAAETHADWNGNIVIDGRDFWLNAWVKEKKADGSKYLSLSIRPKDAAAARPAPQKAQARPAVAAGLDDEIPF